MFPLLTFISSFLPSPSSPPSLQAEGSDLRQRLGEQGEKLRGVEEVSERKDRRLDELQRLLGGMEQESAALRDTLRNREEELRELRKIREEGRPEDKRSANTHTHSHTYRHTHTLAHSHIQTHTHHFCIIV